MSHTSVVEPYFLAASRGDGPGCSVRSEDPDSPQSESERSPEIWRRACPLLIGALGVGLVLTRRRLSEAEAEFERVRAAASAAGKGAAEPVDIEAGTAGSAVAAAANGKASGAAVVASDLSSEWEQAVPPMDS
jgi:hypothetical protein